MKRTALLTLLLASCFLVLALPALAQDGASNSFDAGGLALLSSGLVLGIAAGLCGLGQGRAVAAACEGTARNPGAGKQIFTLTIVGLALIESLSIYALVVSILLYVKGGSVIG